MIRGATLIQARAGSSMDGVIGPRPSCSSQAAPGWKQGIVPPARTDRRLSGANFGKGRFSVNVFIHIMKSFKHILFRLSMVFHPVEKFFVLRRKTFDFFART